jgi:hypothetical protein
MTDDDPLPHEVPPPDADRVRELVETTHQCDPPALAPGDEWVCPECEQRWTADRDGVWRAEE